MPRSLSAVALAPAAVTSLLKEIPLCEGEIHSVSFFPLLCIFLLNQPSVASTLIVVVIGDSTHLYGWHRICDEMSYITFFSHAW